MEEVIRLVLLFRSDQTLEDAVSVTEEFLEKILFTSRRNDIPEKQ